MPTGTLTMKFHCQLSVWVSTPPSSRPNAAPPAAMPPHTESAFVRSGPSLKVVVMIDSAAGETSAPPRPWKARATISISPELAQRVDERGEREDRQAGDEQAPAAEQVGRTTAEQQEAAEHERVGVDDPLEVLVGEAQIRLDRRQGDVHDRRVEDDHELREAHDDEHEPRADGGAKAKEGGHAGSLSGDGVR